MMRKLLWEALKRILFLLDPETAHRLIISLIKIGIRFRNLPLCVVSGEWGLSEHKKNFPVVFGLPFASRVGLAAGFDKDAEIILGLPALGFGFAEIGTVTPRPQPGNGYPRLFRDPSQNALFNRMGFNGLGAEIVAERLAAVRHKLPNGFRVGVNIGKNKETPLDGAAQDYAKAVKFFDGLADYIVINVSSPNTPGLRSLQTAEALKPIVEEVNLQLSTWKSKPPVLLKIAPEVQGEGLKTLMQAAEAYEINGWVLTNTMAGLWQGEKESLSGGWSGGPLTLVSRQRLMEARRLTKLSIISVGGILSVDEAMRRMAEGAELIQLYSGWVFNGPRFPAEISRKLGF
jgi:dihydroorotate dehydrogenase